GKMLYSSSLLLFLKLMLVAAEPSVHILSENLEQLITSSTLEWVPTNGNDETILKDAVIASYQLFNETREESEREDSESQQNGIIPRPVYICRAKLNSVWIPGQLRPKKHVCVVSLYKKVTPYKQFELLINIEGSSRLSWVNKDKYTLIPPGAVTSGSGDNTHKTFIARRKAKSSNRDGSLTYHVGKFLPNENLGVFHFVNESNTELQFEDGEILVETEPIEYEFKYVRFDRLRSRHPKKQVVLGQTTLKNEVDGLQLVESVIGYEFNYSLYWGKGHGLLTGLPFTVYLTNGTKIDGRWGLPYEKKVDSVRTGVQRYLQEGTAVNVSLVGNYTESEVPYEATVICIYKDGERRNITIRDTKREHNMLDVAAVYSPTYFLHNNSHVPTTTTTTTTTTTSKTTSTTQGVTPVAPDGHLSNEIEMKRFPNKKEDDRMISDDHTDRQPPSSTTINVPKSNDKEPNGVSSFSKFGLVTVLIVPLVMRRVT
ncbi:hypothetical protein NQ318_009265, partial [Aromia moschata]